MTNKPREIALMVLLEINVQNAYSNIQLNESLSRDIDTRDENLVREIVYGIIENRVYIDYVISNASKIKLKKIHSIILEILRIGIYQILYMDRIPNSAAVNESVKLAKKYGHKGTIGYVNGVLRAISRDPDKYTYIDDSNKIDYISIKYSHPKWMVARWIGEYGFEFTEALCKANNETPSLNIRVNTLKTSKNDLISSLHNKGINLKEALYARDCLIVDQAQNITDLDEFRDGLFTIQDESSMLVAQIMNPQKGSNVLDVCSAPGGKSTHMAQIMDNKGLIISRDIYEHKIHLIDENVRRLGIDIIKTETMDALEKDENLIGKMDYILLDAPCSGLGLVRRKPEIKWNRSEDDIATLSKLQYDIIMNVKDYLRVGGVLVYSTCTIEKDENINLIKRFIEENPNYSLTNIEDNFDYKAKLDTLQEGYIQLFPHIHKTDGFFIAKMFRER
ncbi:MAG TPA: 16S rRNA (cytosine(967)-C(5))-methyltransferase RsmB [Tissierellaceae bacterium]|nr:16S rRNA (cytosine(967)-C(5))-methyltransferase RsmB [Tissierellaceae bacterium]